MTGPWVLVGVCKSGNIKEGPRIVCVCMRVCVCVYSVPMLTPGSISSSMAVPYSAAPPCSSSLCTLKKMRRGLRWNIRAELRSGGNALDHRSVLVCSVSAAEQILKTQQGEIREQDFTNQ